MISFVIDETHLRRLSTNARNELLRVLQADLDEVRTQFHGEDWAPDRDMSYPLSLEEAKALVRGITGAGRDILRVFATNADGDIGYAELDELLRTTGYTDYEDLGQDISTITQSMRSVTGNGDGWLFNWRPDDWDWDESSSTYKRGAYFISGPAVETLREAFGMTT